MNGVPSLGASIEVYWSHDEEYYAAEVGDREVDGNLIIYNDKEKEILNLHEVRWRYAANSEPVTTKERNHMPGSCLVQAPETQPKQTSSYKRKRPENNEQRQRAIKKKKVQNSQASVRTRSSTTSKNTQVLGNTGNFAISTRASKKRLRNNQSPSASSIERPEKIQKFERRRVSPDRATLQASHTNQNLPQEALSLCTYIVEGVAAAEENQTALLYSGDGTIHHADGNQAQECDSSRGSNDVQQQNETIEFEAQKNVERKAHILLAAVWMRNNLQVLSDKTVKEDISNAWIEECSELCMDFVRKIIKSALENYELDLDLIAAVNNLQNTPSTYSWLKQDDDASLDVLFRDDRNASERNLSLERSSVNRIREKLSKHLEYM